MGYLNSPWGAEYNSRWSLFDTRIAFQYGSRELDFNINMYPDGVDSALAEFQMVLQAYLMEWDYELKTLYETTKFKYNPIFNYEGTEKETTTRTPNLIYQQDSTTDIGATGGSNNTTNSVAPYNSSQFVNQEKNASGYTTDAQKNVVSGKNTETGQEVIVRESERGGNMGTTSTQSMIVQEREVAEFDFYNHLFKKIVDTMTINIWR